MRRYALLLALALTVGCSNDDVSLTIAHFGVLQANCTADPAATTSVSRGIIDTGLAGAFGAGYTLIPVVRNNEILQMTATMSETSNVYLRSFDVELSPGDDAQAAVLPSAMRKYNIQVAQQLIAPGGGQVSVPFEVLPPQVVAQLGGAAGPTTSLQPLSVRIRAVGQRAGVTQAGGFGYFPLFICNGCLLDNLGACGAGFPANMIETGTPCAPAQDAPISCCTNMTTTGTTTVCGSAVPVKTGM